MYVVNQGPAYTEPVSTPSRRPPMTKATAIAAAGYYGGYGYRASARLRLSRLRRPLWPSRLRAHGYGIGGYGRFGMQRHRYGAVAPGRIGMRHMGGMRIGGMRRLHRMGGAIAPRHWSGSVSPMRGAAWCAEEP